MDTTLPDKPTFYHVRAWLGGSPILALLAIPKVLWIMWTRRSEFKDLLGRTSRCDECSSGEWCERHRYHRDILVEAGIGAYWDYADYLDREGYPTIYRMALEYADREKRSRKRGMRDDE